MEVSTRQVKQITRAVAFANNDDFSRIFAENMNSLYLLAFLLTAAHARSRRQSGFQGMGALLVWPRDHTERGKVC